MNKQQRKMQSWHDLKNMQDVVDFCKRVSSAYHKDLSENEKERIASPMACISACDDFDDWQAEYPILDDLDALASDLEWSNAFDVDEDWGKLKAVIAELDQEVNKDRSSKPA
jgi:hypothetical protein